MLFATFWASPRTKITDQLVAAGTQWGNGYDSGYRGDCIVTRQPPCCGEEPLCEPTALSPVPCITRDPDFIPPHNVSATCVCADTYVGLDCSDTIADTIIRKEQAKELENPSGCFARASEIVAVDQAGQLLTRKLSDLRVGDRIASMDYRGHVSATEVVFLHDHTHPSETLALHFLDANGGSRRYELTGAHAVPTALDCHGDVPCLQFWCFSSTA